MAVKLGIIIIKEIKLPISLKSIKELNINVEVEELEFSNNKRL